MTHFNDLFTKVNAVFTKLWVVLLFVILSNVAVSTAQSKEENRPYTSLLATTTFKGKAVIALRQLISFNQTQYWVVDPQTFETAWVNQGNMTLTATTWPDLYQVFSETPYVRALKAALNHSNPMQDAGIIRGISTENGISLTIDLCPSHKPLDRGVILAMIDELHQEEGAVPLALSVTGLFMEKHPDDILWVLQLIEQQKIKVTWVNHTFHHFYDPRKPMSENFMLEPGISLKSELLETEQLMTGFGIVPSVFFRFPGLVSDAAIVQQVIELGLIPIGADAWLAKGQKPVKGSIVLIHANGNEPKGIYDFLQLLQEKRKLIHLKQWQLISLATALKQTFNKQ
jgi:hypothetical protein